MLVKRCSECDKSIDTQEPTQTKTCSRYCRGKRTNRLRRKLYAEDKQRKKNERH